MKVRMPDGSIVEVADDALLNDDDSPFVVPPPNPEARFTSQDLERVRQEEKDKLYGRIDSLQTDIKSLTDQVGGLTAEEQRRKAALEDEQARAEAEARALEEKDLDAKALIARREQEWQDQLAQVRNDFTGQLETERQAREQSEALRAKERQFNDLREYAQTQVTANEDKIAPELLPWIQGNTQEEIDAAVTRAIDTTNRILEGLQNAGQVPPPAQQVQVPVGVRPVGGPSSIDPAAASQTLTAEQIANMPMEQYAKLRGQIGVAPQGNNRGLFG